MLGHPDVVDDDVVGSGGAHAGGVPDVFDVDRRLAGSNTSAGYGRVVGPANGADHDPVGIHDPGRP